MRRMLYTKKVGKRKSQQMTQSKRDQENKQQQGWSGQGSIGGASSQRASVAMPRGIQQPNNRKTETMPIEFHC